MNIKEKLRLTMKASPGTSCRGCHYVTAEGGCNHPGWWAHCSPRDSDGETYNRIYVKVKPNGD